MRTIIREPNKLLHRRCEPVTNFVEARRIADELQAAIRSLSRWWNRWLGLAANQIGYSKRIVGLRCGTNGYQILVNPEFVVRRLPFPYFEKCYSLPSLREVYVVKRYLWARIKYQDGDGTWQKKIVCGPSAIYQEIDHLDGIMVSDVGWRIR